MHHGYPELWRQYAGQIPGHGWDPALPAHFQNVRKVYGAELLRPSFIQSTCNATVVYDATELLYWLDT